MPEAPAYQGWFQRWYQPVMVRVPRCSAPMAERATRSTRWDEYNTALLSVRDLDGTSRSVGVWIVDVSVDQNRCIYGGSGHP